MSDGKYVFIPMSEYLEMQETSENILKLNQLNIEEIRKQKEEIKNLQKALDKAVKYIANLGNSCPLNEFDDELSNCENCNDDYLKCWKEWCLKDE